MLRAALPDILDGTDRTAYERWANDLQAAGVSPSLAGSVAAMPSMIVLFDIVEAARPSKHGLFCYPRRDQRRVHRRHCGCSGRRRRSRESVVSIRCRSAGVLGMAA